MTTPNQKRWLKEHFSDTYVQRAQKEGYRSRAAYKLIEIQQRDRLFKPGMTIVDLGASPGGWSQVAAKLVMPKGRILALDLLSMPDLPGVEFIQGDIQDEAVMQFLQKQLGTSQVDWVLSDMSPNLSGNESIDIPRALELAEVAYHFALSILRPSGGLLMKVFQGAGTEAFAAEIRSRFQSLVYRKPKASRGRSREIYLLARGMK